MRLWPEEWNFSPEISPRTRTKANWSSTARFKAADNSVTENSGRFAPGPDEGREVAASLMAL